MRPWCFPNLPYSTTAGKIRSHGHGHAKLPPAPLTRIGPGRALVISDPGRGAPSRRWVTRYSRSAIKALVAAPNQC